MAINLNSSYPTKTNAPDSDYPYGSARNQVTPGDGTGTPLDEDLVNDIVGFQQALLDMAGISPTGSPDKVGASQYLEAITSMHVRKFPTLAAARADTTIKAGDAINLAERTTGNGGGAMWDVVLASGVTPNTYNIVQCTGVGTLALVLRVEGTINVDQLGAVDGTDSTGALKAAFGLMPSLARSISLSYGATYLFNPDSAFGINLQSLTNFSIDGNFATIKCLDAAPNSLNGVIMWLENCEDGVVKNLILDGNLPTRTGTSSLGSHNIKLRNANKRIRFENCKFLRATNDGFYLDADNALTPPEDIELIDCEGAYCYRGNVSSIDSERLKITGGSYHHANGNNPRHGIDLEDDNVYGNKNYLIEDVDIYSNGGEGLQMSGAIGVSDGVVRNIRCWDNGTSGVAGVGSDIKVGLFNGLVIDSIFCKGNTNPIDRALIDFTAASSSNLKLRNIDIKNANPSGGSKNCVYLHSSIVGSVDIEDIKVDGTNSRALFCDTDDATVNGLIVRNSTAGNIIGGGGDRIKFSNLNMYNNAKGPIISGNDCVVDGFQSVNCADASLGLWMNGSSPILRNAMSQQTVSIPGAQEAYVFTSAPREISNVRAISAGTDYTAANLLNLIGGVSADTAMSNISPGFYTEDTLSADNGDSSKTLTRGTSEMTQIWNTPLTAERSVTLSTTNAKNGDEFKIVRTASATGAFNLNVGTGPLKAMVAGSYSVVRYDGSSWVLAGYGTL